MALEGEELTALTIEEQKSEGVQHREKVVAHVTEERKELSMSSSWTMLVVLITSIAISSTSLILAIWTEDIMCITTAPISGIEFLLSFLAVILSVFSPRPCADTFDNPEAVCLFHSRISWDDPAFKRYSDQELPPKLEKASNSKRSDTFWLSLFGLYQLACAGLLVGIGVFFIVKISEVETLLCSLGLLAEVGICMLVLPMQAFVGTLVDTQKEPNHEDLIITECSLFDDGVFVIGRNKCIRLHKVEGTKVEWSENRDVMLLKVDNSSIVLSCEEKEKEWWKALVQLRKELNDIV